MCHNNYEFCTITQFVKSLKVEDTLVSIPDISIAEMRGPKKKLSIRTSRCDEMFSDKNIHFEFVFLAIPELCRIPII